MTLATPATQRRGPRHMKPYYEDGARCSQEVLGLSA